MCVVYYKYKSEKETFSVPVPHSFISVSELKQLILTSGRHGRGRTRGRGPREDIAISNAQTGEEYADESTLIPQNTTVLIRRTVGQLSEKIVLFSREVIEDGSIASNKSVVTEATLKSCSSTEVQDEDAAITAVIDAAELIWEEQPYKRGQASGRLTSGHHYGHGPLEGEAPPPGYVCRSCGVPGHFIRHCLQEIKTPPPGYICYRCRTPGHFIHHCPTIGDPKFDNYKMSHSLAPVVSASPIDGIPSALAPAVSVSVGDDLPAELHCRLCNKVMTDAVLTSKCCFNSFCDKCIRDYIITQSKCICGVKVLADNLIPNHTLRSTISNMLATRASSVTSGPGKHKSSSGSNPDPKSTISNMLATRASSVTSGTGKHKSSSGSNPDPKSQSHTPSTALERVMKQSVDHQLASATPDYGLRVATEDGIVNRPQENLAMDVDLKSKDKSNSAGWSVEKAVPSADVLKLKDGSESTSKDTTISGTLEPKAARTDKLKKKRKKSDSTKIGHPNIGDCGYSTPLDPAYYSLFNSGYPWVTEPYMYGPLGMPYGGYPMGPYGVNSISNMPPQRLTMQGYPANYPSWETQSRLHWDAEAAARSRQAERPKDIGLQSRSSERNQQFGSHGTESRNRSRSRPERRDQERSDRASNDYDEDHHSRKRMRACSPMDGDKQSGRRSRHSSRSLTRDDSSDDERNFKRRWGRRSSVTSDTRF